MIHAKVTIIDNYGKWKTLAGDYNDKRHYDSYITFLIRNGVKIMEEELKYKMNETELLLLECLDNISDKALAERISNHIKQLEDSVK